MYFLIAAYHIYQHYHYYYTINIIHVYLQKLK